MKQRFPSPYKTSRGLSFLNVRGIFSAKSREPFWFWLSYCWLSRPWDSSIILSILKYHCYNLLSSYVVLEFQALQRWESQSNLEQSWRFLWGLRYRSQPYSQKLLLGIRRLRNSHFRFDSTLCCLDSRVLYGSERVVWDIDKMVEIEMNLTYNTQNWGSSVAQALETMFSIFWMCLMLIQDRVGAKW